MMCGTTATLLSHSAETLRMGAALFRDISLAMLLKYLAEIWPGHKFYDIVFKIGSATNFIRKKIKLEKHPIHSKNI